MRLPPALAVAVAMMMAPAALHAENAFFPLSPVVLEMYDQQGLFHTIQLYLVVVVPAPAKLNKTAATAVQRVLMALPYEELAKPDSAKVMKTLALQAIRSEPGGENASEVLIAKLLFY